MTKIMNSINIVRGKYKCPWEVCAMCNTKVKPGYARSR